MTEHARSPLFAVAFARAVCGIYFSLDCTASMTYFRPAHLLICIGLA